MVEFSFRKEDQVNKRQLCQTLELEPDLSKDGRELVCYAIDDLLSGTMPMQVKTVYTLRMQTGVVAGNHFHQHKHECLVCMHGEVGIYLIDPENPKNFWHVIIGPGKGLVVPPGIAHAVENVIPDPWQPIPYSMKPPGAREAYTSILLVLASGFPRDDDDHEFDVRAAVRETAN